MGLSRFFGLRLFGSIMPAAMVISCLAALSIMPVLVQLSEGKLQQMRRAYLQ